MGERARRAVASVGASRSTILVFAAIWVVGLGALAAVNGFEARVDTGRQAEVLVETLQRQVGNLAQVAFNPAVAARGAGPTAARARLQMRLGRQQVRASLTRLDRFGRTSEDRRIDARVASYFPAIDHVAALVRKGSSLQAALEFGRDAQPTGSYGALLGELRRASGIYSGDARRARLIGSIGTDLSVLFMLAVFSLTLYRARRLAREKHQLLKRSQVEALTDALTGLPNRRALFADMDALLHQAAPPDELTLGMFDLDGFKEYNDTFGHPAGDALLARCGRRLADVLDGHGTGYRMGGDEFCVIIHTGDAEALLAATQEALGEDGKLFSISCSRGSVLVTPNEMTLEQALQQADQRLYNNKRTSRRRQGGEGHDVLLKILSETSPSLAIHLGNVARLAEAVAQRLCLGEDEIALARLTAELHDVGKTAIPDAILDKPGPLDDEEWAFMRRHTIIGERILAAAPALAQIAGLVRSTHERHDGGGYPDGLRANEIPLPSRIVSVVDAYDAMTTKRPYRPPISPARALSEIRRCSGTQFDPAIANAFVGVMEESLATAEPHASRSPAEVAV